jgi:hypothetical protein
MRPSQVGIYQAVRPRCAKTAGTSVIRTRNASMTTPIARANAMVLVIRSCDAMKLAKTKIMITAAEALLEPEMVAATGSDP